VRPTKSSSTSTLHSSNAGQFVEQEAQSRRLLGIALLRSGIAADAEALLRSGVAADAEAQLRPHSRPISPVR
jgi:voltage-gated potassium channel Kch